MESFPSLPTRTPNMAGDDHRSHRRPLGHARRLGQAVHSRPGNRLIRQDDAHDREPRRWSGPLARPRPAPRSDQPAPALPRRAHRPGARPHDPRRPRRGRGHTWPPRRSAGRPVRRRGHVSAGLLSPPRRPGSPLASSASASAVPRREAGAPVAVPSGTGGGTPAAVTDRGDGADTWRAHSRLYARLRLVEERPSDMATRIDLDLVAELAAGGIQAGPPA